MGQMCSCEEPGGQKYPARQGDGDTVFPVQAWPPGQVDGASRPVTGQKYPIGQGKTAELFLLPGQNPPEVHVFA